MGSPFQSRKSLPPALSRHVVVQDYSRYEAADQATWRFILLHLVEHLRDRAHPLFLEGLKRTGLSTERIPRIEEIDEALAELGWSAVCVSGFVPPRAFQRFQALRVLPIAGDIRAPWHVAYTPAPDIVHEAAGHAPLIVDPVYAQYLQRVGELGELAFSSQHDLAVHEAVANLSDLKERTSATDPTIAKAEQHLEQVLREQAGIAASEATRMARLYWWTAEYGLVGTPEDYKMYGAGLLSSLGEAVYSESPNVEKRELDVQCLDTPFDITRPQPQLFVVRDFERLFDVLGTARAQLASVAGGIASLRAAARSGLPSKTELTTGHAVCGLLTAYGEQHGKATWLDCQGALVGPGDPHPMTATEGGSLLLPLGNPISAPSWYSLSTLRGSARKLSLQYEDGVRLEGLIESLSPDPQGPLLVMRDVAVQVAGRIQRYERYHLPWLAEATRAVPDDEQAQERANSVHPRKVVPTERTFNEHDEALRTLYARADHAWRTLEGQEAKRALLSIRRKLDEGFPEDWLLRWNLLESLLKLGDSEHAEGLKRDLEQLEERHAHLQPIATGLRSLTLSHSSANDAVEDVS